MKNFADRLLDAIDKKQNPSCIGLDPRFLNIPNFIKQKQREKYGSTFEAITESFFEFNKGIIDSIYDVVPVVKPQMAFYEQYGPLGVLAFQKTVDYAKKKGLLIIEDAKRNDVGSTVQGYADGHLGKVDFWDGARVSSFDVDAITVNGYLGSDGISPFVQSCKDYAKGIFVLVKSSNPSSVELQDLEVLIIEPESSVFCHLSTVFTRMAKLVDDWGQEVIGDRGYSSIGAVVGATYPEQAAIVRKIMPKAIFLVPGYGAQGASVKNTLPSFNKDGYGAIVNSSREVIFAYQREFKRDETEFDIAARTAAISMKEDLHSAMNDAGISP